MNAFTSFQKQAYHKSELLGEMLRHQADMVKLTFSEDHAAMANLKTWDVVNHLTELNEQCGHVADEELQSYRSDSKEFNNLIKAEISGQRGEYRAFRTLDYIKHENRIVKNVELSGDGLRTEIDALTITEAGLTIVEVKNTAKDIFIDERGDYYRTGEYLKWDCNIGEKMAVKETLLRRLFTAEGIEIPAIHKLVVFTDNRIQVQNKFSEIKTCFVSQLAYLIDGFSAERKCTAEEMERIEMVVKQASASEVYPFEFDIDRYKREFAVLMAKLEAAKAELDNQDLVPEESEQVVETPEVKHTNTVHGDGFRRFLVAALAATAAVIFVDTLKKGGNA